MREINNSHSSINFQKGIQPAQKMNENPSAEPETVAENKAQETDLRNMPAEMIGRSQVVGQTALEKDLAFLANNYEDVERADRYMQYLMDEQGMDYEHAAELATEFAREFAQE